MLCEIVNGACTRCHWELPTGWPATVKRACPEPPCRHLGQCVDATAAVMCTCASGQRTEIVYAIHQCEIHDVCLPHFQCTTANKSAVREEWTRSDGGDPDKLMPCVECRDQHLGFEPVQAGG